MAKKKLSVRAVRRDLARKTAAFIRDADRLAQLETGGTPERPIDLASASEVEVHARSMPCPRCGGELRVEEHLAETFGGARLRVARVVCSDCHARRSIYFRLGATLPS